MSTLKVNQITDLNDAERFNITSGTAVASTSGTSIDFTGIPSWVKRITVMFSGVSTNGTAYPRIQLGISSGVETSGYNGSSSTILTTVGSVQSTSGFDLFTGVSAAEVFHGFVDFRLMNQSSNLWVCSGVLGQSNSARTITLGGSKSLAGTLDRIRFTTSNGTNTFDAGSINILYEA